MSTARPIVTFDLDGVLCRPPLGINPGRGRNKRRDSAGKRGLLWITEGWRYIGRGPMAGARRGFLTLTEMADCKVVSARGEQARMLTEEWFGKHFGYVPEIHLRPSWHETSAQFKIRKVEELGSVAHFEDDPHTAAWLADEVAHVYLVDWWRNRWLEHENITRIHRITDALPTVAALLQNSTAESA